MYHAWSKPAHGKRDVNRTIALPGEFTTLNEYILSERSNRFEAAKTKKRETDRVTYETLSLEPLTGKRYDIVFCWYRRNKRTDPDNIAFAAKFILDGLTTSRFIPADRWSFVSSITHLFFVDKDNPRVEIKFEQV